MGYYGKIRLSSLATEAPREEEAEAAPVTPAPASEEPEQPRMERATEVLEEELASKVFPVAEVRDRMLAGATDPSEIADAIGQQMGATGAGMPSLQGLAGMLPGPGMPSANGARTDIHDAFDVLLNILSLGGKAEGGA